uniref:Olfactomedin-like domain-containing protein n=1 Tax=Pundamilia nyererei TaxID=303518 RepID=A0A3B4F4B7_9CICH
MLQLLLLLLLSSTSQRVSGYKKANACVCQLNSTMWVFPAQKFKYVLEEVHTCEESLNNLQEEVRTHLYALLGLITNISDPITTKVSPHGKSYISGSWGKQAQNESKGQKNSYWVQPLLSSHIWGNTVRLYQTYEDFMASTNHREFTFASSYSHPSTNEGPNAVLYGEALYYHCYRNHGNLVISRLVWDSEVKSLNVTQTWETRLFKKATSNAFMVCGVMYATRYVNEYREEVFYAFDTATGKEDNSLAIPLEKVAKAVASLSYNPTNKQIYMYNDGYLLAYQAYFRSEAL